MKILFIVPYPIDVSPSQRFRFEQYFSLIAGAGHIYEVQSFLQAHNWKIFYKSGNTASKLLIVLRGLLKRTSLLFRVSRFDFIFVHREAAPIGPPIFECIVAKIFRKKIIYDYDDAIWLTDREHESFIFRLVKARYKVRMICKWSYKISCGNTFLQQFALAYNPNAIINPTTIDTVNWHNPALFNKRNHTGIVIGWTGTHSTLKYLNAIEHILDKLLATHSQVSLVVIADQKPNLNLPFQFIKWSRESEIQDLLQLDIGVMPLTDDEWSKGKCGFKALQYMALEIPAVVSPVGVNTSIIQHGVDGFVATSDEEWYKCLRHLVEDASLRSKVGKTARESVIAHYSVEANLPTFFSLFE